MYYLQSRYYDPQVGRFINADGYASTGQGILGNNMFAYCRNNPACREDALGTTDTQTTDGFSFITVEHEIPTVYGTVTIEVTINIDSAEVSFSLEEVKFEFGEDSLEVVCPNQVTFSLDYSMLGPEFDSVSITLYDGESFQFAPVISSNGLGFEFATARDGVGYSVSVSILPNVFGKIVQKIISNPLTYTGGSGGYGSGISGFAGGGPVRNVTMQFM